MKSEIRKDLMPENALMAEKLCFWNYRRACLPAYSILLAWV